MEFGRHLNIDGIDFSLPPDPAMTKRVLESVEGPGGALQIYVGGTGWGQTEWLGKVYPRGAKPKDVVGDGRLRGRPGSCFMSWGSVQL